MKKRTQADPTLLPIGRYQGPITVVNTTADLDRADAAIRAEYVVGLDTETRPAFRKGEFYLPCLVQVATAEEAFLFQLEQLDCSDVLADMLEAPGLIKTGIGLKNDFTTLKQVFPFKPASILDLSKVAREQGFRKSSVRYLAAELLGFRITKGASTSNWANPALTRRQINYAATDAWVCRELFLRFQERDYLDEDGYPTPARNDHNSHNSRYIR